MASQRFYRFLTPGASVAARTSTSTFTTSDFEITDYVPAITTGLPTGHLRMNKTYVGQVEGRSVTQFTSAFDQSSGVGTYVALESFEVRLRIDADGTHHMDFDHNL